jgi:hypothetical protein
MYRILGVGYVGARPVPVAIDYTLLACSRDEAVEKVRRFGVDVLQCTVSAVPDRQPRPADLH